jgi:hypothetical protein
MSTRHAEPTWDECPHCGAVIPTEASYCADCGKQLVARRAPADRRRAPPLPVVLGVVGLAAIGLGALLAILLTPGDDPVVGDATPTATSSATLEESEEPSSLAEPTPSPSPTAAPRPALANRSIVEVETDGLELRTQPGGGDLIGSLGSGSRAFVIGSPQDASGERWYRIAVVEGPYSGCGADFCPNDIGFVADGASDADAKLVAVSLDCPSSPMTAAELNTLLSYERLACYGGTQIVVTGTLDHCYCDGPIGFSYHPPWLAAPVTQFLFDGTFTLWLRFVDPPGVPEELVAGDIVEVMLAMEHEAAPDCSVSSENGQATPSRASAVLDCRTQLVVESLDVTGHDEDAVGP